MMSAEFVKKQFTTKTLIRLTDFAHHADKEPSKTQFHNAHVEIEVSGHLVDFVVLRPTCQKTEY